MIASSQEFFIFRFSRITLEAIDKIIFYEIYDTRVYFQYRDNEFPEYIFNDPNIMEERLRLTQNGIKAILLVSEGEMCFKLQKVYGVLVRVIYKSGEEIVHLLVSKDLEVLFKFEITGEEYDYQ